MNQNRCENCGFLNPPNMNFCTSCGNEVVRPAQSSIPTIQKTLADFPTVDQSDPQKKGNSSSKFWIIGLLLCAGLIGVSVVGVALILVISNAGGLTNQNVNISNNNKRIVENNSNTPANKIIENNDAGAELFDILSDRKEVGKFTQLTRSIVDVNEFFPHAKAAAQASYHNGSRYVALSIGKFENFDDAKKNFDEQFANVKKKGGKTQILPVAADGTINGVFQVKGVFTAEYCTKSAFCYRMASKDAKSLKAFLESFVVF